MTKAVSFTLFLLMSIGLSAATLNVNTRPELREFKERVQACIQDSEDKTYTLEEMDELVEFCMGEASK